MRGLIQRVSKASVVVNGECVGTIDQGLLLLLGVQKGDALEQADNLLHKILNYRVFSDDDGKMNLSLQDIQGGLLVVSQFTLAADTEKGLRPGFSSAAAPNVACDLYEKFVERARENYQADKVATGIFAADMKVSLLNDGPVTFLLEV